MAATAQVALGTLGVAVSSALMLARLEPVASWYYCFVWWFTILAVDGVNRLRGRPSLLFHRPLRALALAAWSASFWFAFEVANHRLQNWTYVGVPAEAWARQAGSVISFATVLPAICVWADLMDGLPWLRGWRLRPRQLGRGSLRALLLLGLLLTLLALADPRYAFGLIWVGPTLALGALDALGGRGSLLERVVVEGRPRRLLVLLAAGGMCGLLWELYNMKARAKWLYTVPGLEELKLFEMPVLGFLGFPPFAVACYLFVRLLNRLSGVCLWDFDRPSLEPMSSRPRWLAIPVALAMVAFWILELRHMERTTVWSQRPLVTRAGFLPASLRQDLLGAGLEDLEDVSRLADEAPEELCRTLAERECDSLVESAKLASFRGLGVEGASLLHEAGVTSLRQLAAQEPALLWRSLSRVAARTGARAPREALVRLWVRDARRVSAPAG